MLVQKSAGRNGILYWSGVYLISCESYCETPTKLNGMKYIIIFVSAAGLFACNNHTGNNQSLQTQMDSLQNKMQHIYKPGFGGFMSNIQTHYANLWFAGQNKNWKLASFEINEIKKSLAGI